MSQPAGIREYALQKTAKLLEDVVAAVHAAAENAEEEAVHKMRVSIRRLQQALRLFRQYFKAKGLEKLKTELRSILKVAGELRNRDIAMALVAESGGASSSALSQQLSAEREELQRQLGETLKPFRARDLSEEWRKRLGIEAV